MLSQQLQALWGKTTPVGFEPARGDPVGLAGRGRKRAVKGSRVELAGSRIITAKDYSLAKDKVPRRRATCPHVACC